jgi:DNA-binding helix-hairpin-helix protein with protein kinase domain
MPDAVSPGFLYDSRRGAHALGRELGRGGEGSVYELPHEKDLVAKLYHRPADPERAAKIMAMSRSTTPRLCEVAAWPVEPLSTAPGGGVVGFLMPRCAGRPIHALYGPKSRLVDFPSANWAFLIQAAANLARAFSVVHEQGHVIGDVNQGNCLVSPRATVTLIDCDSFQIAREKIFHCTVGTPIYTPAELYGQPLASAARTAQQDGFGLAVLIFQLLFIGRHPYAGKYLDPRQEMPIERAIREGRFAYGSLAGAHLMEQPPFTPSLNLLPASVAGLFERAFSAATSARLSRPAAREWVVALEGLGRELASCPANASHQFPRGCVGCPWCSIENATGALLFALPLVGASGFDLDRLWREILKAMPPPVTIGSATPPLATPSASAAVMAHVESDRRELVRGSVVVAVCSLAGACAGLAGPAGCSLGLLFLLAAVLTLVAMFFRRFRRRLPLRRTVSETKERIEAIERRDPVNVASFDAKRQELEKMRNEYLSLPTVRQARLDALQANVRSAQLRQYLDLQRIAGAKIPGIGPGRAATLASYGIETAWDVTARALAGVHGFGPKRSADLLGWRTGLERRFTFNPSSGLPPGQLAALDQEIAHRRRRLESVLVTGAQELERLSQALRQHRERMSTELARLRRELAQAEADLAALHG